MLFSRKWIVLVDGPDAKLNCSSARVLAELSTSDSARRVAFFLFVHGGSVADSGLSVGRQGASDRWSAQNGKGATWVYFLNVNNEERIKVGQSTQTRGKRMQQHSKSITGPIPVELLCEVRGHVTDEKAVQRFFKDIAIPGGTELFHPRLELIEYIRWLRDRWFVAMPNATDEEREALPLCDSSEWLPDSTRRKPRPQGVLPGILGPFDLGYREITGDDFYTSEVIVEAARRTMGSIDLDPASHAIANRVVKASQFYTRADNGLDHNWYGKVWLNPPFSAWSSWSSKLLGEWASGRVNQMCVLSAMRTVTAQYFAPLLQGCHAVCIIRGRIRFWGGVAGDSPDDGHAIFYFGQSRNSFREAFSNLGTVFYSATTNERNPPCQS